MAPDKERPGTTRRGRGAIGNPAGRFERRAIGPLDDSVEVSGEEAAAAPLPTVVTPEAIRSILSRNDSPDVPFDVSINPYRGCEHGCVYCFARPTHAYLGLSPGLDFETRIMSKPDAPEVLRREISRRGYRCETVALGANTDPYQPVERRLGLTRRILEVLKEHDHPVAIVTKSDLVLRDVDLLAPMAARRLASVMISVTTLDRRLARLMEPRAPTSGRRLEAMRALSVAGVPVGVLSSPMIPGLNDHELESILEAAAEAGAVTAGYVLLRLPLEIKQLFTEWLEAHYPLRAAKVLALVRETRGGRLYDSAFGTRMRGTGPLADLLRRRFEVACARLGLDKARATLDTALFRRPADPGGQLKLF
jgi:DNA repair photolyase